MDAGLYRAAREGNIEDLIQNKDHLESQLTPTNNTVLHVAAQFGHIQCVMEVLNTCPSMYRMVNSGGDTALHIAAREGQSTILRALVEYANALDEELEDGVGTAKDMLRMANAVGDTALHEAVRNHHPVAVQLLTREDPEFCHPANCVEETPLYLAAERGYVGLVFVILETCSAPAYGGPGCRTALHSAVIHNHEGSFGSLQGCTKKLLDWKGGLAREADLQAWTPLHYAAQFGHLSRVRELLNTDKSVGYLTDKDDKKTALHLAASRGHVDVMQELISHCPDCWEIVDGRGRNILHLAVKNHKKRAIKFILQDFSLSSLINQKDIDGNTPLHLLAASDCYAPLLVNHPKVDRMAFNKESLTPLDMVYSDGYTGLLWDSTKRSLINAGAVLGQRDVARSDNDELATKEKYHLHDKVLPAEIRRAANTNLIVAALIATATFSAGFTIPGGYNSSNGRDQGMATLTRKAAFKAFVVTDALALISSIAAACSYSVVARDSDRIVLLKHDTIGYLLLIFAMGAMVLAFVTGFYAVLADSSGLAVTLCIMGCFPFLINHFFQRKVW
ncbi:protein ACCELERATED CELL DEATH 6-like [Diospyros lotus]|uniref:protein ACCELERATED CELL DEATH 6-like n=1 Tax=Diospyros lotus TaxID=55363 RepID=UPI0022531004|nr:protein ACCELERATED CELL DEATH 6-like [Diospyros lotus]